MLTAMWCVLHREVSEWASHGCGKAKQELTDREPSQPTAPLATICSLPLLQEMCLANKAGYEQREF